MANDPNWHVNFSISPDTKKIVYQDGTLLISQYLPDGPPTILADILGDLASLQWSRDSNEVVYTIRRPDGTRRPAKVDVFVVSPQKRSVRVATIGRDRDVQICKTTNGMRVVSGGRSGTPSIWSVNPPKPCLCIYERLIPSKTSDRFLGVEIDTFQLVVVNADFEIERRVEYFLNPPDTGPLYWSADERYAYRSPRYISGKNLERIDTLSGEVEWWNVGRIMPNVTLTDRVDEVASINNDMVLIRELPEGGNSPRTLFARKVTPAVFRRNYSQRHFRDLRTANYFSSNCRFAVVVEKADKTNPSSWQHRLIERSGESWIVEATLNAPNPCYLIGFANNEQTLVAFIDGKLVAIPLEKIMNGDNVDVKGRP